LFDSYADLCVASQCRAPTSAGLYLNNWHLIFAYVILMSLPLLIVFTVAQRRIISGITSGAVK